MPLLAPARARLAREVTAAFAPRGDEAHFTPSPTGPFGPNPVARRVHAELGPMMVGGVASLLMQMLHPRALAGVWDHSDWERQPHGRLRRTARFIAVTTYGAKADAEAAVARVRRIHARVAGTLPDGTPYRADDPALLSWVHAAEAAMFLAAHRAHHDPWMGGRDQDRYWAEMADVARALGATDPPASRAEAAAFFAAVRPALRADDRTRRVAHALLSGTAPELAAARALHALAREAAVDLMPAWARALHGFAPAPARAAAARGAAAAVSGALRWAMRPAR